MQRVVTYGGSAGVKMAIFPAMDFLNDPYIAEFPKVGSAEPRGSTTDFLGFHEKL